MAKFMNSMTQNTTGHSRKFAFARRIRWRNRLVWLPPTGRPYYVDRASAVEMTDEELASMLDEMRDWVDE